jgi:hypothetical protein
MNDTDRARDLRARAGRIRDQSRKLKARADSLPPGAMREMLAGQAKIMADGAYDLETQALALAPPLGTA